VTECVSWYAETCLRDEIEIDPKYYREIRLKQILKS